MALSTNRNNENSYIYILIDYISDYRYDSKRRLTFYGQLTRLREIRITKKIFNYNKTKIG